MWSSSVGFTTRSVAHAIPVQMTGAIRPPASNGRRGIMGSDTTKTMPTERLRKACRPIDVANQVALNALSCASVASPMEGSTVPASRLMGSQRLPASITPHAAATTAIAIAPAIAPFTPLRYGWIRSGTTLRGVFFGRGANSGGGSGISQSATGIASTFSCGKTSRNQPITPTSANTAPTTTTKMLVTIAANMKVTPNAVMIGHGVGRGIARRYGISRASRGASAARSSRCSARSVMMPALPAAPGRRCRPG